MRVRYLVAGLCFLVGGWLIGEAGWPHAKAWLAQQLLQDAWTRTLETGKPHKPWPWADTWPIGRLWVPRLGIDQIILADASGRSLAFGPGRVGGPAGFPAAAQPLVLSGHRDTHFSFLQALQLEDQIVIETMQKIHTIYTVHDFQVVDSRTTTIGVGEIGQMGPSLLFTTCYPFDAILPGGPLRYVVSATPHTGSLSLTPTHSL